MIYDCFTFFNENDLVDIRLNVLNDIVDKFVIIEATKTHSGIDKPLYFDMKRFEKFKNKIIYIALDDFPEFETSWTYENYQRNYIFNVLKENNCNNDDIIIISDCDEIPSPAAIIEYKENPDGIKSLEQNFYYYYLNLKNFKEKYWYGSKIFSFGNFYDESNNLNFEYNDYLIEKLNKEITLTKIRLTNNCSKIKNGGWHFSFCGGTDKILEKIKSFSHQEFNKKEYTKELIEKRIAKGEDIFKRKNFKLIPQELDNTYPSYILNNQEVFSNLIFNIPKTHKTKIKIQSFLYKLVDFLYSKEKDGSKRILQLCGLKFVYDKNTKKRNKIDKTAKLKNVKLCGQNKIYPDVEIKTDFKDTIIIGEKTHIGKGCVISNWDKANKIIIGKSCTLGFYNNIYGQGGVEIGDFVMTASNVCILTSNHGYNDYAMPIRYQESSYKEVVIGSSSWIGYNVIILPGVNIGKHCTIGAGSVVTKDIPDYSVAVGNPCKVIKKYNFETNKWENING